MIGGIFLVGMEILFLMALGMKNGDLKRYCKVAGS